MARLGGAIEYLPGQGGAGFRVTLPLAMPGVLAAVLIVSIPTVGDYVTPRLVGGSGGTMIANMIYAQIFDLNDRPMGATLAVLAMAIVALSLLWLISRIRFWLWLAETRGTAMALGAALERRVRPLATSQTRMVWSLALETRFFPSGV